MGTNNKQPQKPEQPQITLEDALKAFVMASKRMETAGKNLRSMKLEFEAAETNLYVVSDQVERAMTGNEFKIMKDKVEELEKETKKK